jgi:uncharacterized membrane protein YoaK (UPF0700 family)
VSVSFQTGNGLGRDIQLLTDGQILTYQKVSITVAFMFPICVLITLQAEYANKLLYIATLCFAKLSIISLLMILTASKLHRNLGLLLTGFIAAWSILSGSVSAFQCGALEP